MNVNYNFDFDFDSKYQNFEVKNYLEKQIEKFPNLIDIWQYKKTMEQTQILLRIYGLVC